MARTRLATLTGNPADDAKAIGAGTGIPISVGGGGGATTLAALTDVSISSPAAGQGLVYDGSAGKWKNGSASAEKVNVVASSGSGTVTIPDPWATPFNTISDVTLTGTPTFAFPTAAAGKSFSVLFRQDATGGRTFTLPGGIVWLGGGIQASTAANAVDIGTFLCTDGTNWIGSYAPQQTTTGWTNISAFTNSWVNFGAAYVPARYRKDALAFVHLEGMCTNTVGGSSNAFTLPAGFRPGYELFVPAVHSNTVGAVVDITTAGVVNLSVAGTTPWFCGFSVVFLAEN